ncbi:hypothetical protein CGLO_10752 [Colletotrichum gloeosporioides Cg-14]|uniref:Uncharacterized protein n=1 Tax=Colletotrichum gloeosporioides (strain Cg-14) TaxID=1237896 RepID=T0K2L3_COLGC|nr:hypothetical protein CGLO_10752 [Colletotrichum gloeosporioides Cg-14]
MAMTTVSKHEPQWELAELNSMRLAQNDKPLAAWIGVTRKACTWECQTPVGADANCSVSTA